MREKAAKDTYIWPAEQLDEWAEALESSMREPVASLFIEKDAPVTGHRLIVENGYEIEYWRKRGLEETPLFALPSDAAAEIERLRKTLIEVHYYLRGQGKRPETSPAMAALETALAKESAT
jgi:DNA-dependent RNA polymerase auxiliary subunit epsilon